jgi:hypothetical protein
MPALVAHLGHLLAAHFVHNRLVAGSSVELEGDAEKRKANAVKLPPLVKRMPPAKLRLLLRAAQVPDQQYTDRRQLIVRLKQIEKQSSKGHGLSVAELIAKAGLDGKGKRASPEGAASTAAGTSAGSPASQGRLKRLRRGDADCVNLNSDDEDEEVSDADMHATPPMPAPQDPRCNIGGKARFDWPHTNTSLAIDVPLW